MTENESKEATSAEEFAEIIQQQREQRIEQVSFEWVETIREAGEAYRETNDIEAVASKIGEDGDTTEEALTVYTLLFDNRPMWTGKRAIEAGRAYFSLDRELTDGYDAEECDEPVEDLLREYVGGLYLDKNIDDEVVGEPPEDEQPPTVDIGELFDGRVLSRVTEATVIDTNRLATAVAQPTLSAVQENLSAVMALTQQREKLLSQRLAMLAGGITEAYIEKSLSNFATIFKTSKLLSEINLPQSVLADLHQINTTAAIGASAHSTADPLSDFADLPTSIDHETPEITEEIDDRVEQSDEEDDDVAEYLNWEARYAEAHTDGSFPAAAQSPVEVDPEIPVLVAYRIVSEGETYRWLSSVGRGHQVTVVSVIIMLAARTYGLQNPAMITVAAPSLVQFVFGSDGSDDT